MSGQPDRGHALSGEATHGGLGHGLVGRLGDHPVFGPHVWSVMAESWRVTPAVLYLLALALSLS